MYTLRSNFELKNFSFTFFLAISAVVYEELNLSFVFPLANELKLILTKVKQRRIKFERDQVFRLLPEKPHDPNKCLHLVS